MTRFPDDELRTGNCASADDLHDGRGQADIDGSTLGELLEPFFVNVNEDCAAIPRLSRCARAARTDASPLKQRCPMHNPFLEAII
jgi:hypothetical protein